MLKWLQDSEMSSASLEKGYFICCVVYLKLNDNSYYLIKNILVILLKEFLYKQQQNKMSISRVWVFRASIKNSLNDPTEFIMWSFTGFNFVWTYPI